MSNADAFQSELDYLWDAVKVAQDAEARSEEERSRAKAGLEHASSRVAHLERALAAGLERERWLKAEAARLRAALDAAERGLAEAAARAGELRPVEEVRASLRRDLARKDGERAIVEAEAARLKAETAALRETLKGRDAALEALKREVAAVSALPEIARVAAEDSAASGQPVTVYAALLKRLEKEKEGSALAAAGLAAAERELEAARKAAAGAAERAAEAAAGLQARGRELEALRAALNASEGRNSASAAELAGLEREAAELKTELGRRETALERAAAEAADLRRQLDAARAETARTRDEAAAQALRAEQQKGNFSGAVAQVFELQKRAASLKAELTAAQEKGQALAAALAARDADIEKVNGLLREAKNGLAQERDTVKRAAAKLHAAESEIEALKAKVAAAGDYSAKLLRAVQERDLALGALKADLRKTEALEMENEDLRRRNVKFTGLVRREQSDFTAKVIAALERAAKDLKTFNVRIPAAERKGLEPAMKNVLASVNLLKGWQEYMDPETPELADADLSGFFSGETGKWERAFKQRKLAISYAVATPRLRARLHSESMKMLFYHLVKNAYERLPSGGSLRITLKASEDGRQAVLSFEDTGPGFQQETLGKLFAPFNTTDKGKAGIGLAVANRIAEKHGGTLSVANRKDRGAAAELRLPLGG